MLCVPSLLRRRGAATAQGKKKKSQLHPRTKLWIWTPKPYSVLLVTPHFTIRQIKFPLHCQTRTPAAPSLAWSPVCLICLALHASRPHLCFAPNGHCFFGWFKHDTLSNPRRLSPMNLFFFYWFYIFSALFLTSLVTSPSRFGIGAATAYVQKTLAL